MIDDYRTGLACALGVVGTLLVLSNVPWGGWLFSALLALAFWRKFSEIMTILLDWIQEGRDLRHKEKENKELEASFGDPASKILVRG